MERSKYPLLAGINQDHPGKSNRFKGGNRKGNRKGRSRGNSSIIGRIRGKSQVIVRGILIGKRSGSRRESSRRGRVGVREEKIIPTIYDRYFRSATHPPLHLPFRYRCS